MATLTKDYQFLGRSSVMTSTNGVCKYYLLLYGKTVANETTGIHKVTIKEVLASITSKATYYWYTQEHNGKINGATAFSGTNKPKEAWELSNFKEDGVTYTTGTLLGEGSIDVDCTNGLAKDINLSCYYKFNGTADSYTPSKGTSRTVSVTATLPAIPRASSVSGGSGNIEGQTTISITRANDTFTHTLKYEFGSLTGTIATGVGTSYKWTIPKSFYSQIPSSNAGTGKIICETYSNGTLIGTENVQFTAKVVNSNPVLGSLTYKDTNAITTEITGNNQRIIRNNSDLLFTIGSATGVNSATISKYEITFNEVTQSRTSAGDLNFGKINLSSNSTATLKVTDSRGNSSTKTLTVIIDDWKLPSALITYNRKNNFYSETYLKVDGTYSSLNGKNSMAIQYQYRKMTDKDFTELFDLEDNKQATLNLDNNYQWHIIVIVGDRIGETKYNLYIDRGIPLAFFDKFKSSVGVNCFPENENSFEVDGNIYAKNINDKNLLYTPHTENNKLTITATRDDYFAKTEDYCYLEAGKKYTFSCKSDAEFGGTNGTDTVEVFLLKDNAYDTTIHMNTNPKTFTCSTSGKYYLRVDANQNGKTHYLWDFQIEEGDVKTSYFKGNPLTIVDVIYPVGSIYMSVNQVSPSVLFGGTWEQIKDTFLLGAGDTYTGGTTGGSATHTLTVNEMPSHTHATYGGASTGGSSEGVESFDGNYKTFRKIEQGTYATGGSQAHNNMPPYIAVYIWKRIS